VDVENLRHGSVEDPCLHFQHAQQATSMDRPQARRAVGA
jgi:hypothetical protein